MKLEDIRSENGKAYFRFWSMALKALLEWPDQRIEQWAEKFHDSIHDEHDFLYHYLPGTCVIPEYLDERHPTWREQIRTHELGSANALREISDSINEFIYPELEHGQGWEKARLRVEEAIERLGLT